MEDELKPCPFCGGEPKMGSIDEPGEEIVLITCTACSVDMYDDFRGQVIARWNHRAIVPIIKEPDNANE